MYKSGLVPRRMAWLGLIGGPLLLFGNLGVLFDWWDQTGAVSLLVIPEFIWEAFLGIYCAVWGFRRDSPILQPGGERPLREEHPHVFPADRGATTIGRTPPTDGITATCSVAVSTVVTGFKGNPTRVDFIWRNATDGFRSDYASLDVGGKFGTVATTTTPVSGYDPTTGEPKAPWTPESLTSQRHLTRQNSPVRPAPSSRLHLSRTVCPRRGRVVERPGRRASFRRRRGGGRGGGRLLGLRGGPRSVPCPRPSTRLAAAPPCSGPGGSLVVSAARVRRLVALADKILEPLERSLILRAGPAVSAVETHIEVRRGRGPDRAVVSRGPRRHPTCRRDRPSPRR